MYLTHPVCFSATLCLSRQYELAGMKMDELFVQVSTYTLVKL
jgi:hypothetical protein